MMRRLHLLTLALMALLMAACDSTPENVLPKEQMADLMADLYVAESVTDVNRSQFYKGDNDSLRKVLKQSILLKHGVSQELLDSSFMYYGRNLDKYVEVHERMVEILEDRMSHADAAMARAGGSVAGDSVDTWPGAPEVVISRRSPQQVLTFALTPDDNWEKGDQYVWSFKTLNMRQPGQWILAVDYPDGITEYKNGQFQGEGLNQLQLYTDSTRMPTRIYGLLSTNPAEGEIIYLDSISLTRKRVDRFNYHLRHRQERVSTARCDNKATAAPRPAQDALKPATEKSEESRPTPAAIEPQTPAATNPNSKKLRSNNAAATVI